MKVWEIRAAGLRGGTPEGGRQLDKDGMLAISQTKNNRSEPVLNLWFTLRLSSGWWACRTICNLVLVIWYFNSWCMSIGFIQFSTRLTLPPRHKDTKKMILNYSFVPSWLCGNFFVPGKVKRHRRLPPTPSGADGRLLQQYRDCYRAVFPRKNKSVVPKNRSPYPPPPQQ